MQTARSMLFVSATFAAALSIGSTPASAALVKPDGDQPLSIAVGFEAAADGNPLESGDRVFTVTGSYRFFSGKHGVAATFGYSQPKFNDAAELLLLDFDFVWYLNYAQQKKFWEGESPVKPEFIAFAGPGYASLRLKDQIPQSQFSDVVDDFLTVNAGLGVNIHWFQGEDRTTSRGFVRLAAIARWFGGDENSVDWGGSVALGYTFGKRPSWRALEIMVEENCRYVKQAYSAFDGEPRLEEVGVTCALALGDHQGLEDLSGRVDLCGARCEHMRCIETALETVREAVSALDCGGDVAE